MLSPSQQKIYNPQYIANCFAKHYERLYELKVGPQISSVTETEISAFLDKVSLPSISESQLAQLNAPITSVEIIKIIASTKCSKSPGPDSLPNEYYKTFSSILATHLEAVFNVIAENRSLPKEMLQAIITTISTPGKDMFVQPISIPFLYVIEILIFFTKFFLPYRYFDIC